MCLYRQIIVFLILVFMQTAYAKNCTKGISCGNSCIAAWKTCHKNNSYTESSYNYRSLGSNTDTPAYIEKSEFKNDKSFPNGSKYKFRSIGNGYFLCDMQSGKILKCRIPYCSAMVNLRKGSKVEFLDEFKIVEFETSLGSHSCDIDKCNELPN